MNTDRRLNEFEAHNRLRSGGFRTNQRARTISRHPQMHSEINDTIISNPPNFFRELGTLASAAFTERTAKLRKKIGTFGKDLFGSSHRVRKHQAKTAAPGDRIMQQRGDSKDPGAPDLMAQDTRWIPARGIPGPNTIPSVLREPGVQEPQIIADPEPQAPSQPQPRLERLSIAQQGSISVVGMNQKNDKWMRNFVLFFILIYSLIFTLLIVFRILVPTLTITGTLFAGFFITGMAAICAAIAWNYMAGVLGKVFLVALLALEIIFMALLSTQLRWWTVIMCTCTLVFVIVVALIITFLTTAGTRKGQEMFNVGSIIAFIFCFYGLLYFIGVGGYGYMAWSMFIGSITLALTLITMIGTFFWEADSRYEGLYITTATCLAFGLLSFVSFLFLCLLMGLFITLRTHGLSIGVPLFSTDTGLLEITIPSTVFASLF